jgi:putative PIN family toxin of toxin-antitoxin system
MKVVIDTNVLVSGLLTPFSNCGEIVRMVASGSLQLAFDARIISEYAEVLARPKFGFESAAVDALLSFIQSNGIVASGNPLPESLPDPFDEAFLEVAIASGAEVLVTGNIRHFPPELRQGVCILDPARFVELCRKR